MKKLALISSFLLLGFLFATAGTPTITSFSPSSGPVGTLVTIVGTNLQLSTSFSMGGVSAIMVSDTSVKPANYGDTLVGLIMPGASIGVISVTTAGGTATSSTNFTVTATTYPSVQQGSKLVGTGGISGPNQGWAVAISADGNTAMVGGLYDNSAAGAAWVYTRSGVTWTQQGSKLVGTGATGAAQQGTSVSLSADGNTAIVGGMADNSNKGAIWIYTRSAGIWTQQGSKLVGTGATGAASQGGYAALSADGNTVIEGGSNDNSGVGAIWAFTRSSSGAWTQQGGKLVGSGATGASNEASSVSLSADGNTVIEGGPADNGYTGASWIFTRSAGTWTQQGSKLVGTGGLNTPNQGQSVSLSADGNTAIIGGPGDNSTRGAAWVFTRSAGTWTQQGSKLTGTGAVNNAYQGSNVSLSADGNTAILGGPGDNSFAGAIWVFTRSGGVWTQQGSKFVGTGAVGSGVEQGSALALSADGKTLIDGGQTDNGGVGAAWVFIPCVPTTGDTTAVACTSFKWYGTTYTSSTSTATQVLTNKGGCDSTVTLYLTITQPTTGDTTAVACTSFKWYGTTYTSTTPAPTYVLTNKVGCDSTVTLHLTIHQPTTGDTTVMACTSFTWYGTTYTSATPAPTHVLTNKAGCDSTVTLNLTIEPLPNVTVTAKNSVRDGKEDTLTAAGAASYVWSTGSKFDTTMVKPTRTTTYTVVGKSAFGCVDTVTFTVTINVTGIENISTSTSTTLYPNPTTNAINLSFEMAGVDKVAEIEVMDITGKQLMNETTTIGNGKITTLNVSTLAQGLYFVKVITSNESQVVKFIKQ